MLTLKELSDTYNENHPTHAHLLNHADVTNKELNVTKRKTFSHTSKSRSSMAGSLSTRRNSQGLF